MIATLFILLTLAQPAGLVDRTLAIVDGRTITLADARTALALGLVEGTAVDRAVADRLIDRELMLREADRYEPPEPTAEAVDARLAEVQRRAGSDEALAKILDAGGFTSGRLRAWVRNDLRVAAYLQQRFATDERRQDLIADWVADLRRRTHITILEP